ncbi:MAG: type II pantothenate kinase [Clostridiaceae bacterium]|jgi:type II pantothenate kinase|nr:type II pantothenate kinase [Clostridiaceae bacterium]
MSVESGYPPPSFDEILSSHNRSDSNGVLIGLDVGGSTTKIIGFRGNSLLRETLVQASDPIASAYGALGKFLILNNLTLDQVGGIHATGVGASYLDGHLLECTTTIVPEFDAVGLGGLYTAGVDRAVVVSMGTGTSFVYADRQTMRHIIGSGIGGGTLLGLAQVMLSVRDFKSISEMAEQGNLNMIDLSIGDISRYDIPGLSADTTASNFGRVVDHVTHDDIALGIVNLVFQSVGTAAVLAARLEGVEKIVYTGNLLRVSSGRAVLANFADLYGLDIIIPEHAEYATAIGAALYQLSS